jgi:hypothetical protein
MERIRVSENRRYLVTESGSPFFWVGDTAWEIFHRLSREEVEDYLSNRRERGINVIQSVVLAEFAGLSDPNFYGELPLVDLDPTRPNEKYFAHVDFVIRLAESKGQYIGLLPTWGDKVVPMWGDGPVVFNPQNARIFGEFLGKRYKDQANIIWILGGDRPGDGLVEVWTAMAEGIRAGSGRRVFTTLHPCGGRGSSEWFHNCEWLDMNMWQSGHGSLDAPTWEMVERDYNRSPIKPVLDGEPNYEDHPIDPWSRKWKPEYGRFTDYDVRKQGYRSVFAGACGYTYGHHTIWQFFAPERIPVNHPAFDWREAICRPGSAQLVHLRNLVLSRPYLSRIPDQGMLLSNPGTGGAHVRATRDVDGTYAFFYIPLPGQTILVDMSRMAGMVQAWWYDPRNGRGYDAGEYDNQGPMEFTAPLGGPDWVLVLDELSRKYPSPGRI